MEPDGPLQHIQVPATCPYSEPDQSSPCPRIPLPEDPASCYPPIYVRVFQVVPSFRFPHQDPVCTSLLPHTCYNAPPISFFSIWSPEYLVSTGHYPLPCYHVPLRPKYSPQQPILYILSLHSFLNVCDHVSHPYKTIGNIIVLYIFIFTFWNSKLEDKRFCTP